MCTTVYFVRILKNVLYNLCQDTRDSMSSRRNPTSSSLSDVRFRLNGRRNFWKQSCKGTFKNEK